MRTAYAWLLLLISLVHWIGGNLFFEVTYFKEVSYQMNQLEQSIAKELKLELGAKVKMLEEEEIVPSKNVYSDYLSFSAEIDSKTYSFTLMYYYDTEAPEKVIAKQKLPVQDPAKTALLKSLFEEFVFPVSCVPDYTMPAIPKPTFCYTGRQTLFIPAIPSPPPDIA